MFEDVDTELKQRIDSLIKELEDRITRAIASDERLSETAGVLRSSGGAGGKGEIEIRHNIIDADRCFTDGTPSLV